MPKIRISWKSGSEKWPQITFHCVKQCKSTSLDEKIKTFLCATAWTYSPCYTYAWYYHSCGRGRSVNFKWVWQCWSDDTKACMIKLDKHWSRGSEVLRCVVFLPSCCALTGLRRVVKVLVWSCGRTQVLGQLSTGSCRLFGSRKLQHHLHKVPVSSWFFWGWATKNRTSWTVSTTCSQVELKLVSAAG